MKQQLKLILNEIFNMKPEKAVAYLKSLGYKITWNWKEQLKAIKERAFTVAKVTKADILILLKQSLENALAEGQTYKDWLKQLNPILQQKGYAKREDGSAWRKDVIYRTNIQTAYQAGRYLEMKNASQTHPYWQFIAVIDNRTRPNHAALNGKVIPANDPFWKTHYPPLGYNCRCRVRALTGNDIKAMGLQIYPGSAFLHIQPDPGFEINPAEVWQPNLSKYPPELRKRLQ